MKKNYHVEITVVVREAAGSVALGKATDTIMLGSSESNKERKIKSQKFFAWALREAIHNAENNRGTTGS